MKKKYFILLVSIGSFLIFSLLPISNYITDKWRVLHHDYENSYRGISPNKTFLKVAYLLDNTEKYDTILMGSSRSGYMDSRKISSHAYNMKFNFALVGMHLHNLKILLNYKVKVKNLWIGINDYIIWKEPKDHELDFQRKTYKDNFLEQLNTYSFYLLKQIDTRDIRILTGQYHLSQSEELTNPDKANMKTARAREKYAKEHQSFWIDRMTKIKPTLLGYKDDTYRIDKAIEEIQEIKNLCDEHNITLTLFMYPSYYKTYLKFNQYKIEEFKRKLTKVKGFYDFYSLDKQSLNELNWQDSSHFHASMGDFIIKSIQKNIFFVTKETIEKRIQNTRKAIQNILRKDLPIPYIYQINAHIDLSTLALVFSLKNSKKMYSTNNQMTLTYTNNTIHMQTSGIDPSLIIDPIKVNSKNIILQCKIESPTIDMFQLFYKNNNKSAYNEADSYKIHLEKGLNEFRILIPSIYLSRGLRLDIATKIAQYKINELSIFSLK